MTADGLGDDFQFSIYGIDLVFMDVGFGIRRVEIIPAGTQRNNNVFITYKRRRRRRFDVMKTLSLRHYCVMCPVGR